MHHFFINMIKKGKFNYFNIIKGYKHFQHPLLLLLINYYKRNL